MTERKSIQERPLSQKEKKIFIGKKQEEEKKSYFNQKKETFNQILPQQTEEISYSYAVTLATQ